MSLGKQRRQRLIAGWVRDGLIASQEDVVARLGASGIEATQATVSRDLEELGAVKRRAGGGLRYALGEASDPARHEQQLARVLAEWATSVEPAGPLVVVKTPPGSANLVANAIDAAHLPGIAGTIAGDDTVFVALVDGVVPGAAARDLRERRAGG